MIDFFNPTPPPAYNAQLVDALTIACGGLWTVAYFLYIRENERHQTFGMPAAALCMNLAFEISFALFLPLPPGNKFLFWGVIALWLVVDLVLMAQTIIYGPAEFARSSPRMMVGKGLWPVLLVAGTTAALVWHWVFMRQFGEVTDMFFWLGFSDQLLLSVLSVLMLLHRSSTRGHSLLIWACRSLGTLMPIAGFYYRMAVWPESYAFIGSPIATFLVVVAVITDLSYPFVYLHMKRVEEEERKKVL